MPCRFPPILLLSLLTACTYREYNPYELPSDPVGVVGNSPAADSGQAGARGGTGGGGTGGTGAMPMGDAGSVLPPGPGEDPVVPDECEVCSRVVLPGNKVAEFVVAFDDAEDLDATEVVARMRLLDFSGSVEVQPGVFTPATLELASFAFSDRPDLNVGFSSSSLEFTTFTKGTRPE